MKKIISIKLIQVVLSIFCLSSLEAEPLIIPEIAATEYTRYEGDALCFYANYDKISEKNTSLLADSGILGAISLSCVFCGTLPFNYTFNQILMKIFRTDEIRYNAELVVAGIVLSGVGALGCVVSVCMGGSALSQLVDAALSSPQTNKDKPLYKLNSEGFFFLSKNSPTYSAILWKEIEKVDFKQEEHDDEPKAILITTKNKCSYTFNKIDELDTWHFAKAFGYFMNKSIAQ